jgi:CMP-N-acetylneuraminic acid synthetase
VTSQVTAIVPMRHSSERVKGKNYRHLGGKPLFCYIIDTLLASESVDQIVIDTDSPVITEYIANNLPDVLVLVRPEHLRDGAIAMNDVLENTLSQLDGEIFLQTHSTNPFLRPETIDRAVACFFEEGVDSLFTTTPMQARFWWDAQRPVNHDPAVLLRTQDLAPLHLENSCLYVFRRGPFLSERNRVTTKRAMFPMSGLEAIDIDTEEEWALAAALMERRS